MIDSFAFKSQVTITCSHLHSIHTFQTELVCVSVMVDGVNEDGIELVVIATAPLDWTVFTAAWVPSSPRVAAAGCTLSGQGQLRVFSLAGQKGLAELASTSTPQVGDSQLFKQLVTSSQALRCGTFQSSGPEERHYCTGDFGGGLAVWDLESLNSGPVDHVAAHAGER